MLRVDTIGKVNPIGKPHAYFCARREDYGYLNSVTSNLFMAANVAVYYDDEQDTRNTPSQTLLDMNLIIMILTEDLFKAKNDVLSRVFPLAVKNKIPLMILGMSDNVGFLLDDFCRRNGLGNRHVIFPNKVDSNRTFLMKLKDFLAEHAFAGQDREKIAQYFDGRVFLSYRKVDKPLASKVASLINQSKECQSYALWYDEYLTAGENFDDEIQQYIDASDVFLLLMTETMLQKGSYALEREHFRALQEEKTIVILDAIEGPHDLPEELTQGSPILLPLSEVHALPGLLLEVIGRRPCTTKWEKADKSYHIGLAYLRGIEKTKEEDIAIPLIRQAATAGHANACDTMVKICIDHGDLASAANWQTILANHYGAIFQREHTLKSLDAYLKHMGILGEYHGMLKSYGEMKECYQTVYQLLSNTSGWDNDPDMLEHAIIAADKLGEFAEAELSSAENKVDQLRLIVSFYNLSFEYAQKYAHFEHSLKTERFLYTPLMRITDLDCRWTKIPLEDIFQRYYNLLQRMLEADQKYSCYETLCDLSGCYKTLTLLSEKVCPENNFAFALRWLEKARQAFLTSRHLECCGAYAYAMEYVAKLQAGSGDYAEAIRNLNKAAQARTECIEGNEKYGQADDADIAALFHDCIFNAQLQITVQNYVNAELCLQNAEAAMRSYPKLLGTPNNVIHIANLRKAIQEAIR